MGGYNRNHPIDYYTIHTKPLVYIETQIDIDKITHGAN